MFSPLTRLFLPLTLLAIPMTSPAETPTAPATLAPATTQTAVLFEQVRLFEGRAEQLTAPMQVLVLDNRIDAISSEPLESPAGVPLTRIAGAGRILMPGLIDAHTHVMYSTPVATGVAHQ